MSFGWSLYYIWVCVMLFGLCWFGVIKPTMQWSLLGHKGRKCLIVFASLSFLFTIGCETLPVLNEKPTPLTAIWGIYSAFSVVLAPACIWALSFFAASPAIKANPNIRAIGWLVCGSRMMDCDLLMGKVNSPCFRYFSPWTFYPGLRTRHGLKFKNHWSGPGAAWLELDLVFTKTPTATPWSFDQAVEDILDDIARRLGGMTGSLTWYEYENAAQAVKQYLPPKPTRLHASGIIKSAFLRRPRALCHHTWQLV